MVNVHWPVNKSGHLNDGHKLTKRKGQQQKHPFSFLLMVEVDAAKCMAALMFLNALDVKVKKQKGEHHHRTKWNHFFHQNFFYKNIDPR